MARTWQEAAPGYEFEWGGRVWTLALDDPIPGLRVRGGTAGPLLALEGMASEGEPAREGFPGSASVVFHPGDARVEAVFTVPGRDHLTIRAAWVLSGEDAVDLDVEAVLAHEAAGPIRGFEVKLASVLPENPGSRPKRWVEPRDARAAGLSYDGREVDVRGLTTLPPADDATPAPRVLPSPWDDGHSYVEIVRAAGVARRITEAGKITSLGHTTRYGLFGRDLAPGSAVRTRVRGLWILSTAPQREAFDRAEAFLAETS